MSVPIPPYAFGSDTLPGLAKLVEEIGELQQVLGKIIMLGHAGDHWDGTNLTEKLVEEIGDVQAAIGFFKGKNLSEHFDSISARTIIKHSRFWQWDGEARQRGSIEPVTPQGDGYALLRDDRGDVHVFEIKGNECRRVIGPPGVIVKWGNLDRSKILSPIRATALEALQDKETHQ